MSVILTVTVVIIVLVSIVLCIKILLHLTKCKVKSNTCLVGKTAIVTGGNAGIGYEIALGLACRGARVIVADRDDAEETCRKIIDETGNTNVIHRHLDLASFKCVREFAKKITEEETRLDILVNNAGIGTDPGKPFTPDGCATVHQVNFLGAFLMTHLLMDLLERSSPSRVLFCSSTLAYFGTLRFDAFKATRTSFFGALGDYANSKLANIVIAEGFARRTQRVVFASYTPGTVRSAIYSEHIFGGCLRSALLWWTFFLCGKTARDGAAVALNLCLSRVLEGKSGGFFVEGCSMWKPLGACDDGFWRKCEETVGVSEGEKMITIDVRE